MTRIARRLWRGWNQFWFAPASPVDLGCARALFCAGVFAAYSTVDFSAWGAVSRDFWMPIPVFETLGVEPLSPATLAVVAAIWRLALLATAVGFLVPISATIAAAGGFYLLGLPHNFGHTFHFDALLVLVLIVLAIARSGDSVSVDAWLWPRRVAASGEYRWPIRMVWCLMALVFFAAGVAKIRYGGLSWVTSNNMQVVLRRAAYHTSDADPIGGLGLFVASYPLLTHLTAALAVIVEFFFPLALFSRRCRAFLVPAAVFLLVGIRIMMGPTFGGFLIANVFWVPWRRVWEWTTARRAAGTLSFEIYPPTEPAQPSAVLSNRFDRTR